MVHQLKSVILVPFDFSEAAENAALHAARVCRIINFRLVLFHVINRDTRSAFSEKEDIHEVVLKKLNLFAEKISSLHQVRVETMAEEGNIYETIGEKARETGANLMFMGTHGKKGFQHIMGSNALKVIYGVPVPTVVFQKREFTGFAKVLFPVNSFSEVRQKVFLATQMAQLLGSTIYLLKENTGIPQDAARIEVITRQITEAFTNENVKYSVETAEKEGDSPNIVIDYAVEKNMDFILIMTEAGIASSVITLAPWVEKIMMNKAMIPVICINQHELGKAYFAL
ncbi:MAG: universal stress protein [Bacteroidales bacterium]|nr:universal stress protein [Bacteroidales bacterium]